MFITFLVGDADLRPLILKHPYFSTNILPGRPEIPAHHFLSCETLFYHTIQGTLSTPPDW